MDWQIELEDRTKAVNDLLKDVLKQEEVKKLEEDGLQEVRLQIVGGKEEGNTTYLHDGQNIVVKRGVYE